MNEDDLDARVKGVLANLVAEADEDTACRLIDLYHIYFPNDFDREGVEDLH